MDGGGDRGGGNQIELSGVNYILYYAHNQLYMQFVCLVAFTGGIIENLVSN